MKGVTIRAGVMAACMAVLPAHGHHSLAAEFDINDDFELEGTVTELQWSYPHIWLTLAVDDEDGGSQRWRCELGSPLPLQRAGWDAEDLPTGTRVRVRGNRAHDGSNTCSSRNIALEDGTPVLSRFGRPRDDASPSGQGAP